MLLGARLFFERRGGGGWQNPYVTDGLVAMWDGEWNAGGGEHSSSVGLANLAGSAQLTFPSSLSYMSIGEKSLDISLVYDSLAGGKITLPANAMSLSSATIEMCMSRGADSSGEFGMRMPNGVLFHAYSATAIRVRSYSESNSLVMNAAKTVTSTTTPNTVSYTYDGTTAKAYINGALLTSTAQTAHTFNFANADFGSTYLQNSGSIYDIRIYNKAITADEVSANYAIDQARFNLP